MNLLLIRNSYFFYIFEAGKRLKINLIIKAVSAKTVLFYMEGDL
jgi:hypothetical protein